MAIDVIRSWTIHHSWVKFNWLTTLLFIFFFGNWCTLTRVVLCRHRWAGLQGLGVWPSATTPSPNQESWPTTKEKCSPSWMWAWYCQILILTTPLLIRILAFPHLIRFNFCFLVFFWFLFRRKDITKPNITPRGRKGSSTLNMCVKDRLCSWVPASASCRMSRGCVSAACLRQD